MGEKVLVTGATGFIGRALRAHAALAGTAVLGVSRGAMPDASHLAIDLTSGPEPFAALLDQERPGTIFHLAGGNAPGGDVFAANVRGTQMLLQAIDRVSGYSPRVIVVGSAAEYGDQGATPVAETAREEPLTEYGVAKLAQTRLALVARRRGRRVLVVRLFNVIGPGMSSDLAPARLMREALSARSRGATSLTAGNLSAARDYLDVEDVASCLFDLAAVESGDGIVNLCSGIPLRMDALLAEILRQVGIEPEVRVEARLLRGPADVPVSVGDPARLERLLGRRPRFDLHRSVERLLRSLSNP